MLRHKQSREERSRVFNRQNKTKVDDQNKKPKVRKRRSRRRRKQTEIVHHKFLQRLPVIRDQEISAKVEKLAEIALNRQTLTKERQQVIDQHDERSRQRYDTGLN
jgi:hypothetical protein